MQIPIIIKDGVELVDQATGTKEQSIIKAQVSMLPIRGPPINVKEIRESSTPIPINIDHPSPSFFVIGGLLETLLLSFSFLSLIPSKIILHSLIFHGKPSRVAHVEHSPSSRACYRCNLKERTFSISSWWPKEMFFTGCSFEILTRF